jgi:agarase
MPFTVELSTNSFPTRLTTANLNWTTLPDPYDNSFEGWMAQSFNKSLATYESKPNFAGVFVDNEMSWGTVSSTDAAGTDSCALGALAASAKQPARIAFLSQLRSEYGTIRALNSAWGASFSSFNAMTAPSNGALGLNAAAIRDCTTFERAFALTYFEKVKAALEGAGLRSLYLGCRFSTFNDAVVGAASQVVDVLSFNHYGTVDTYPWSYFNGLPKPVLLSETSVGENNEGTFGGNPLAPDSEQRAEWAYAILTTAAKQPNVVGVDWFNYTDWAATGDGDSMANYGYGVVDVCDTPRYPLVSAFRAFAKQLYALRG